MRKSALLKEIIKINSEFLKYDRLTRKQKYLPEHYEKFIELRKLTKDVDYIRYQHIAYSMLRGRNYEQIERPRENKVLKDWEWKLIQKYMDTYTGEVETTTESKVAV